jgi:hypothetical protein
MSKIGGTTPRGKVIFDEQGKPTRLEGGVGIVQAAGLGPEKLARVSGGHRRMESVQADFKERKGDLYSRHRLARPAGEKKAMIRDMQKFNIEARKYRGVIPPITGASIGQATAKKPENPPAGFERMRKNSP